MYNTRKLFLILIGFLCSLVITSGEGSYLSCGRPKEMIGIRIHKGSNSLPGQWPWHVAVFNKDEYQCGGSIIDPNTILTAAHCVYTAGAVVPKQYVTVRVGQVNLNDTDENTKTHDVGNIIVHHNFTSASVHDDIALIKLRLNITMTNYVQPVCLWTMDSKQDSIVGKNGTLIGFGFDERDVLSGHLKQAQIQVIDPLTCIIKDRVAFGPILSSEVFCGIGQAGVSACNGDSGGGIFFEVRGKWFVRGLVSYNPLRGTGFSNLCDPLKPTVFTDVAKYLDWMKQYIDQRVLSYESDLEKEHEEKLQLFNFQTCGKKVSTYTIKNGYPAAMWTIPWIGFVVNRGFVFRCTITLISEWYCIAPAHCLEIIEDEDFILLGGIHSYLNNRCFEDNGVTRCTHPTQQRQIKNVTKYWQLDNFVHNIALLELMTKADTTKPNVQPICMPITSQFRTNATTNSYVSVNYGASSIENIPVRYVESVQCKRRKAQGRVTSNLKNNRVCAAKMNFTNNEKCESILQGLPLQGMKLINGTERFFLRGLDLFGSTCWAEKPTEYLNVEPYLDWILYNMNYHTTETTNASRNSTINQSLESEWDMLLQQPGKEKLRLFDMETCGATFAAVQPRDHVPWMGRIDFDKKITGLFDDFVVVLINEWYALGPKDLLQENLPMLRFHFGLKINYTGGKATYQRVDTKNIIIPDHPSLKFALIELLEPADLRIPYIKPICLPFMEKIRQLSPKALVVMSTGIYNSQNYESKNLTLVDCQDSLSRNSFSRLEENSACATDQDRWKPKNLTANFGSPIQKLVKFGDQLRYFLYGLNVNGIDQLEIEETDLYRFKKMDLTDLEWILENMQEKEPLTRTSNERVNLEPVQVPNSKRELFDFDSCGVSSTRYPAPWIGGMEFRKNDILYYFHDPVMLISDWFVVGGASLISVSPLYSEYERIVIFGNRCEEGIKKESLSLKTNIIESCGAPTQWIIVQKIFIHPQYNKAARYVNDIALIRLAAPANTSLPNVKPICLPIIDSIRSYDTASLAIVDYFSAGKNEIINVDDRYVNIKVCQRRWKHWKENVTINSSNHCIFNKRFWVDSCLFPREGATLYSRHMLGTREKSFLRGFVLGGISRLNCGIYFPHIYTNTDTLLDWMLDTIEAPTNQSLNL